MQNDLPTTIGTNIQNGICGLKTKAIGSVMALKIVSRTLRRYTTKNWENFPTQLI